MENQEFNSLLGEFNKLVASEPKPSSIKEQLQKLKEKAAAAGSLTGRQRESIVERIKNYETGNYYSRARLQTKEKVS